MRNSRSISSFTAYRSSWKERLNHSSIFALKLFEVRSASAAQSAPNPRRFLNQEPETSWRVNRWFLKGQLIRASSGTLDQANDEQENYSTDSCDGETADKAPPEGDAKGTEQEASKKCADHADYEIADEAKATTFDKHAGQPASDKTDNKKPQNVHSSTPYIDHFDQ
ncbi:hypothetical protein J2W27_004377 [Variovorax boronicumulans]|nr:hypothetical protein [Variovorax boronicumulans]